MKGEKVARVLMKLLMEKQRAQENSALAVSGNESVSSKEEGSDNMAGIVRSGLTVHNGGTSASASSIGTNSDGNMGLNIGNGVSALGNGGISGKSSPSGSGATNTATTATSRPNSTGPPAGAPSSVNSTANLAGPLGSGPGNTLGPSSSAFGTLRRTLGSNIGLTSSVGSVPNISAMPNISVPTIASSVASMGSGMASSLGSPAAPLSGPVGGSISGLSTSLAVPGSSLPGSGFLPRYDTLLPALPYNYGYPPTRPYSFPEMGTQYYDPADLALLASDLNNLVADMMATANPDSKFTLDDTDYITPPTPTSEGPETKVLVDRTDALQNRILERILEKMHMSKSTLSESAATSEDKLGKNDNVRMSQKIPYPEGSEKGLAAALPENVALPGLLTLARNTEKLREPRVVTNDWIPRNVSLGYIDVRSPEERMFLQEFHHEFAGLILPFGAYDRPLQSYYNPVRDILLKCASREPFLLAAILAQGARATFSKSGAPEHEEAYCHYLLRCLKLLGPALGHASGRTAPSLTCNIEAVLLTVLLLTSSNAANAKQNWRPHLKGAKDLLLKHTSRRNSKVLIFCKYWFALFEVLAGLGLRLGGTVHLDAELDLLLNLQDPYELLVLSELGLVLPNGFNLISGYHHEMIQPLRDLIKLLNRLRRAPYAHNDTLEYIRLLAEFHRHLNIHFVNQGAVTALDDFPGKIVPDGLLLEPITVEGRSHVLSWMDLSQQMYALAAITTILTEFFKLPFDSPQVQMLTRKMTDLLALVPCETLSIKYSVLMIQWPLVVAGLNCVRDLDKFAVSRVFSTAAKLGAGSAGHLIKSLRRAWRKHEGNVVDSGDESAVDVVTY